ncbi:EAL domain-containing protein [Butyrivibrio sp. MC2013]|uniref:EAL domain-containing protein n=1 Tax=Butyrivibrio sp. MC2013 TaxID=1280686 RepID=UPI000413D0BE|nr:EAL domain-containing protein [Butyrivibrio sp. MC2013]
MSWNIHFEIASVVISVLLLASYLQKKHLPFRAWHYFSWIMYTQLATCIVNILACIFLEVNDVIPVPVLYLVNMLYYLFFSMELWSFAIYTMAMTGRSLSISKKRWFLFAMPFTVIYIIVLTSPLNKILFSISSEGEFIRGKYFHLVWGSFLAFYSLVSISYAWFYKHVIPPRRLIYTVSFWVLAVSGMLIQGFLMGDILIEGLFNSMAIVVIYLEIQNPYMYMDCETELYNQWALGEVLDEKLRYKMPIGMVCVTIDNFVMLESIYGRPALMQVVHSIGMDLQKNIPEYDVFYMHRGRFGLVSRNKKTETQVDEDELLIRKTFSKPWILESVSVLFRFTMVRIPVEIEKKSIREIFEVINRQNEKADKLTIGTATLYTNKETFEEVRTYFDRESAVNKAIRESSVEVYYQPLYSVSQQRFISVEALARLGDKDIGPIAPDDFIFIAEQNGTIDLLGAQIFEKVCAFIHDNEMSDLGIDTIAVNLSPVQCRNERLPGMLREVMERYQVDPSIIVFEITESAAADQAVLSEMMNIMGSLGCRFSLDDYGTGYSNLINLLELPFKAIKIDKSIVWSYFGGDADVLPGIMNTFKGRGLEIVAEGIETRKMADELTKMGCDHLQGFYYSKPLPEKELKSLLYNDRRKKAIKDLM